MGPNRVVAAPMCACDRDCPFPSAMREDLQRLEWLFMKDDDHHKRMQYLYVLIFVICICVRVYMCNLHMYTCVYVTCLSVPKCATYV